MLLSPEHTTTYTLTATGPYGAANAQVTVMVSSTTAPQPEASFGSEYENLIPTDSTVPEYAPERFALITGLVTDLNDTPLVDVSVTMHSHPEYGTTFTDADGRYTIPVQGGGNMTVVYNKVGFITSHRQADVPWNDIAITETVQLLEEDDRATTVTFDGNPNTVITHTSTEIVDEFGSRSATMVFTGDNRAYVVDEEGYEVQTLFTITTRATEYVTPESMPAALPPTSAFTYCSEFKVDGVDRVKFAKPVITYVDNFLGFEVGEAVPLGYYDRDRGVWTPSDNGVVVELLDTDSDGTVDALDSDGDGLADDLNQNGSYADEVIGLDDSTRYTHGSTFWRVGISHFTPWDCNWPFGSPLDAIPPNSDSAPNLEAQDDDAPNDCERVNSYVKKRGRAFHEDILIPGTDMTLHYTSNRTEGYKQVITVPASGTTVPASLKNIIVRVEIAGRTFSQLLEPLPSQQARFVWDGLDHVGHRISGVRTAKISIGFAYQAVYLSAANVTQSFAQAGSDVTGIRGRQEFTSWQRYNMKVQTGQEHGSLAEGWTLSNLHFLDPNQTLLFKGNGTIAENSNLFIETVAGIGTQGFSGDNGAAVEAQLRFPKGVAVDAEGNLFITDFNQHIRKVDTSGVITSLSGNLYMPWRFPGYYNDLPAIDLSIDASGKITVDTQGNIYWASWYRPSWCVNRIDSNGIFNVVAGTGIKEYSGDGGLATEAGLYAPRGVAVDNNGNLFIADSAGTIRKISPSGIIEKVIGTHAVPGSLLYSPHGIAVNNNGDLFIADTGNHRVVKIDTNNQLSLMAGSGSSGYAGDGGPATSAMLYFPDDVDVAPDGTLYIADTMNHVVRKVSPEGIISTIAGNGFAGYSGDNGFSTSASLNYPIGVAVSPDGSVYIVDHINHSIRRVFETYSLANLQDGDIPFADDNGLGYIMSAIGLHKKTINLETGLVLREFNYDSEDKPIYTIDQFGNTTTIERNSAGTPTAIVSPDGIRTVLHIDADNHLRQVVYPDNSAYDFSYTADGLMTLEVEPNGNRFEHVFDENGRIIEVLDEEGGNWQYTRQTLDNGDVQIDSFTGEGNRTTNVDHTFSTEAYTSTTIDPSDDQSTFSRSADGLTVEIGSPSGMSVLSSYDLDPQFMFKYVKEATVTSPAGLQSLTTMAKGYVDTNADSIPDLITDTLTTNSKAYTLSHDVLAATKTLTSPLGRTTTTTYDPTTLATTSQQVPGLFATNYSYYADGKLQSAVMGSRQTSYTYDSRGNLASVTDPAGKVTDFTSYDANGRLLEMNRADSTIVRFSYDANGNMTVLTPPSSVDHGFTYNKVNKESGYQTPISGNYSYVYDRDRRLVEVNHPSLYQIRNIYDKNRLRQIVTPEGTVDFTYLPGSRPSTITKGIETIAYSYDGSLPLSETFTGTLNQSLGYSYNNDFTLATMNYAGGSEAFTYDNDNLPIGVGAFTITRNIDNGLPDAITGGAMALNRIFDGYGELNGQTMTVNGSTSQSWNVVRDLRGKITSKTEIVDGATTDLSYTYDDFGRLLTVTKDSDLVEEYRYDQFGMRNYEFNALRGIAGQSFTYSTEDHLLTAGAATYQYDVDGFLTTKTEGAAVTGYTYSSRGELLKAILPDGRIIEYKHDPLGRRIAKMIDGVIVEKYLWKGLTTLLAVYDGSDNLLMRFEYGDGRMPLAMESGGNRFYLGYDQVSSLRTVTDTAGTVVKEVIYDSFGNIISDSNTALSIPLVFAGGLHDRDTGLVRFGYRDFIPSIGRWAAKDPIRFAGGDVDLYGYVQSDPVNSIDPMGLFVLGVGLTGSLGTPVAGDASVAIIIDHTLDVAGTADIASTLGYQATADASPAVIISPLGTNEDFRGHAKRITLRWFYSVDITIPDHNPWAFALSFDVMPGIDFGFGIGESWGAVICDD